MQYNKSTIWYVLEKLLVCFYVNFLAADSSTGMNINDNTSSQDNIISLHWAKKNSGWQNILAQKPIVGNKTRSYEKLARL